MAFNLKSEEEVKQYLDNLGVEYRYGCFSERKPDVCHLLGDYLEAIKKDFEKAAKVYKSTCEDYNFGHSCLKYGNYCFLGKGKASDKGDAAKAYQYYEKGCDLNNPDSCFHAGLLLMSRSKQQSIQRDVPKAFKQLTQSCEGNNGNACFYLSGMHISGVAKDDTAAEPKEYIVPKDMRLAFGYAQKACELGNFYACANLSQMYAKGDGTEKNEKLSEKYKKLALEMQEELKSDKPTLTFQQGLPAT